MSDISSDEDNAMVRLEDIPKIKPGMFVSGWQVNVKLISMFLKKKLHFRDDPNNDDGIEEDKNPHGINCNSNDVYPYQFISFL